MATYTGALIRACTQCKRVILPTAIARTSVSKSLLLGELPRRLLTTQPPLPQSTADVSASEKPDYPVDYEVSYDEFKYVLPLLPAETVPELPEHSSYPTPSGWFPPNLETRSKQKYLIRRTKNHLLPVYPQTTRKRIEHMQTVQHSVIIKKIEGDIWALEAELRHHLQEKTGLKLIKTQVHEVGRFIRVRGLHTDLIASFLLERGM